ncbi:MAG: 4Fe-4S dicluster domain-containing protein [Deltaproteobacteria bacterium]|nr:4Fe-4S dicluster domain-containing protein [Deltaproteobacteria bacterium]
MNWDIVEEALRPYEIKLQAQERLRRRLGVKEVDQPTYERYIIGPIERFDRRKNAFLTLKPDNPFGEKFRERFKARTGQVDWTTPLPYNELEPEDRLGRVLATAVRRPCFEYHPEPFSATPPEGRLEARDPAWMSRLIKKVGLFLGAEMVRITKVDPRWVYKDIEISHPYAIIIVVSHVRSMLDTAPSYYSWLSSAEAYARLKFITTQLTDFIRGLGYDAMYRETLGHDPEMLMVPIAIDAGVGEFSRNGRVLSPEFGTNMRLKAVTTDLPLQIDKPISFNTHEYCMACENCAIYCPARANPFGPPTDQPITINNNPGYRKWYVNAERCLLFWGVNRKKWMSCGGRCIAVCPWNKEIGFFHNIIRWIAIHGSGSIKKILAWTDRKVYQRRKSIVKKGESGIDVEGL